MYAVVSKKSQGPLEFRRLLDCTLPATLDPPTFRGLAAPRLSQMPTSKHFEIPVYELDR